MKTFVGFMVIISLAILCSASYAGTAIWQGYGGDIWNTNSSPYALSETNPLAILWSITASEGQFKRTSGICFRKAV